MKTCFALAVAIIALGALLPEAQAAHPTRICLDIERDREMAYTNDDIVDDVRAHIGATDAGHPPEQEGCVTDGGAGGGGQVDFEITGASDPDDSDTPETPDRSCDIPPEQSSCWMSPPRGEEGNQQIAGWIDYDRDDATVELDRGEDWDEDVEPGDDGEPDGTDVILWTWSHGQQPPSDKRFVVTLSIRRTADGIAGRASSIKQRCVRRRQVVVRRERPGNDLRVGATRTNPYGRWAFPLEKPGTYYAFVPRLTWTNGYGWRQCIRATSTVIRL